MRIIHLSDIHFSNKEISDFDNFITNKLINDLEEYNDKKKIDMILITGDLLYKGGEGNIEEGFKIFKEKFIDKIIEKLGMNGNQIFFVPGNHDIDRKMVNSKDKYMRNENGLASSLKTTVVGDRYE